MSAGATVTQADRDLAEEWRSEFVSWDNQDADEQVRDLADDFARHRLATEAEFAAREAALVEALEAAADRLERAAYIMSDERLTTLSEVFFGYADSARAHTTSEAPDA